MSTTLAYIRINLTRILVIVTLLATLATWYFVSPEVNAAAQEFQYWNVNIIAFTLFIGLATISSRYIRNIARRGENWLFMAYGLIVIVVWTILGISIGLYSDLYQTAFLSTKITLHIAILGQLVFFVVSGAYRTFRMKSLRTFVFAISALLMVVFNAPWLATPYPVFDKIAFWLLNNPQMAASRAMVISGGVGGVILGIRILLGLEKGALRVTEAD